MANKNGNGYENKKISKEPGIYEGLSFEEYLQIDAINHSELKEFKRSSPLHYLYRKENGIIDDSDAKNDGRIYHLSVLEYEEFKEKYIPTPNDWKPYADILPEEEIKKLQDNHSLMFDGRTKSNKLITIQFNSEVESRLKKNPDLEVIDYSTYRKAEKIREAFYDNEACKKLTKNARFELTAVWIERETGLKCKGRIDIDGEMKGYFADLKKTKSTHPISFARDARRYGYGSQMAFYMDGLETLGHKEIKAVMIVAIEDYDPFYVQPFYMKRNSGWIVKGREWYRNAIEELHYCKSTNHWHGYYDKMNDDFKLYELPELM